MKKGSTYVHKPGEKYIVIKKENLQKYLDDGYLQGTGISKEEYRNRYSKAEQTNLAKYGVKCIFKTNKCKEAVMSSDSKAKRQESIRRFYIDNYGVENGAQVESVKEKTKNTLIEQFGSVEEAYKSRQESLKKTCIEKYGVRHPMQTNEVKEKLYATMKDRYGVKFYAQTNEFKSKSHYKYEYDNLKFDSTPELAVYIYAKEHNIDISRNHEIRFEYMFNDSIHYYFPDFIYEGRLLEIKGDHFFKDDGTMCNPFDHSQDALYEAKHQCMIEHEVTIWTYNDYKFALDYLNEIGDINECTI